MILIEKLNEVYLKISTDEPSIKKEIARLFEFQKPGFQHDWNFKKGWWNGKRTLFNSYNGKLYIGLLPKLLKYLNDSNYEYTLNDDFNAVEFSIQEAKEFVKTLNLPFEVREYQLKYFIKCVRNSRHICVSPTSSGKSLIIYLLYRYYNTKTLLIVPTTSLVEQMCKDFIYYGYTEAAENIHLIYEGRSKTTDKKLTISTWQSIYLQNENFFEEYRVVIGDEVHGFKADSLIGIMNKTVNTPVKIGFTGTVTGEPYYDHIIEGLFGSEIQFITSKQMMDKEFSSKLMIRCIILKHVTDNPYRDAYLEKLEYQDELKYITDKEKRNIFIANLALSLNGNSFVMFRFKEHGKALYELIRKKATCPVYYVDGETDTAEREKIREYVESHEKSITVCSTVFSTGINITSINNLIFAFPSKSRIKVLQSIGRGLRISKVKFEIELFDIADDITSEIRNITLEHFRSRLQLYKQEQFDFKFYKIDM